MRRTIIPILVLLAIAVLVWSQQRMSVYGPIAPAAMHSVAGVSTSSARVTREASSPSPSQDAFPPEVAETLALIRHGGPFPHRQDGVVFENREHELPMQPRGYYHEYTVDTPGARHRGARRIITGGDPPVVYYYTDDHYRSFRTLEPTR
ncbi:MAG TPA: ribonuclease domain-containing protein [Xanthomonadaceae bacterium]|nr:ribonuclease domain-containing protein [Xanthomonadaceae bacterium]